MIIYQYLLSKVSAIFPGIDMKSRLKRFVFAFIVVPAKWVRVALDEDTGDDNDESDEAHGKTGVVYRRRLHRLVHNHHQGVAQRHGEKHQKE